MYGALFLVRTRLDVLSVSERKVADYVLAEPKRVVYLTIGELAERASSSQAAVTRLCKKIGIPGFQELKIRLAREVFGEQGDQYVPSLDLDSRHDAGAVSARIIALFRQSLSDLEHLLDSETLERSADDIFGSPYTHFFGIGASGLVAYDFYLKLQRIGIRCGFVQENHSQIVDACSLRAGDVGFFVSYSGETDDMVVAAREAKAKGAIIHALTKSADSSLAALADRILLVPPSESTMRQGAIASRIDQLAVVDILFSLIISRDLNGAIESMERTFRAARGEGSRRRREGA